MVETRPRLHASEEAEGPRAGFVERLARGVFLKVLAKVREGSLTVREGREAWRFGAGAPEAEVRVHDPATWRRAVFSGDVGLGDAYRDGQWSSPDLVAVVRFAIRNMAMFDGGSSLTRWIHRFRHRRRRNSQAGSRRNVADHYDLGNEFYALFLDETLAYSCAVFERDGEPLAAAQKRKFDLVCRKLRLGPRDHLLEIGTGWGGFAAHAAREYGCRVTTTTISARQHESAERLFARLGLDDRITLLREDYRDLRGTFDKIASIEMFEAVGLDFYDDYFGALDRLLRRGGAALVQTITMNEQRFPAYVASPDWIQKRIFPGAELACLSEVLKSLGRASALTLFHMEDIGAHYARTLRIWREAFLGKLDAVRALGFDERFIRTWEYYLAYCEGAFAERYIGDAQLLLVKPPAPGPLWGEP